MTLIPAATQWVIAGSPASVPGILIIALGRSTAPQRRSASWMVARVSCASAGETSSDTCPSTPPVTWCSPANSSQAARTSATASASKISPALRPCSLSRRMSASYEGAPGDGLLEDCRIRGHAPEAVVADQPAQLAGGDQVAGDVVVPGTLPELAQAHQGIGHAGYLRASSVRTISAARSGVNLNSWNRRSPGAEAPKPSIASIAPEIGRVPLPAERRAGFDAQPDADPRRQDLVAVRLGLRLEQLPRGQRHDAHPHPVGLEQAGGGEGHVHLGAGGDQDRLRVAAGRVEQHVPAPAHAGRRPQPAPVEHRKLLTGEHHDGGTVGPLHRRPPRLHRLGGVRRAEQHEIGDGPEHGQVFHRLVSRAVFAHPDRIVGADDDDRQPHDRRQADGGLHVVGEDQEGAAERPDPAVRRDAVEARGHSVLPHAPVELPPGRRRPERPALLEGGAGAAAQIGRAADQVGDRGGDAWSARPEACRVASWPPEGEITGSVLSQPRAIAPPSSARTRPHAPDTRRRRRPSAPANPPRSAAPRSSAVRQCARASSGHIKRGLRGPAEDLLGPPDLLRAKRGAVRLRGVPLGRRRIGDDGAEDDQCRTHGLRAGRLERLRDRGEIVAVPDPDDVPSVGLETERHLLAEGERGVAVDGDVIVVVEQGELAQPEMTREGDRLARDPFHQVAVAGERPGPVVHDIVARPVELLGQQALGDGHAHRVADSLAQRAGGGLHARRVSPLRMARRARAPLPEGLDARRGSRSYPLRWRSEYSSIEAWPQESTNRSRSGHAGSAGLWRRKRVQST